MPPKVSVIVPVYKVEEFFPRCLRSLEAQTIFDDLEILLVDDGTPDRSGDMCDEFAARHENVRVLHRENGGQGSARNAALDIARGEYIAFLDSDDYVVSDIYERTCAAAREHAADIVYFRNTVVRDSDGVARPPEGELRLVRGNSDIFGMLASRRYGFTEFVWDKLYRRELFDGLRFPLRMKCEDTFLLPSLLARAQTMVMLPEALHFYRQRPGSTMHTRGDRMVDDRLTAHKEIMRMARERFPEHLEAAKIRTYFVQISSLNFILDCPRFREHPCWKRHISELRRALPDLLRTKSRRYLPPRRKAYAVLLALFPHGALVYERIRFHKKRQNLSFVQFERD